MTTATASRPNFLVVVVDDMGYSDCQPFGGEIATPHLQRLAESGARFRGFHTSSLCAPTRSMLLSGCDNHQAGLGVMQPLHALNQYMQPGYEGYLNHSVPTMAELLRDAGYRTYLAGKWHVGITEGTRPAARGFDRSFAFLGGGASHFHDARPLSVFEGKQTMYADDDRFCTDELPEDFYTSTAFVDRMIGYLREHDDDRPFLGYLAFTAPHDPLQVPDSDLQRYAGHYDAGYEAIKHERMERMKEIGLISSDLEVNPGSGLFPTWENLSEHDRQREARKMEIYAAMIERMDHELGRLLDELDQLGKREDTVVFFLSDNGANPKQPEYYQPNTVETIEAEFDNSVANMGRIGSFVSIGGAWAEV
ncbi:sulfatase-like hydrolase/transferase, partial [Dietzia massiliensis]|uniref:sulfatase-like hydrolase/transferase n=1 Tax=Dietzia massiliensis TaxID=2697499 RepID=UPI001BCCF005